MTPMPTVSDVIRAACDRVAPSWPLTHFVAANPFLGVADMPCGDALTLMERGRHATLLPGATPAPPIDSVADIVGRAMPGCGLGHDFVVDEISKWCASYFDRGQSAWPMPWRDQPLWTAWRAAASIDATPELMGLRGFRHHVRALPDNPSAVIAAVLDRAGVSPRTAEAYLFRLLMSVAGWSGYVQYRVREQRLAGRDSDELVSLLAIRAVFDGALLDLHPQIAPAWRDALSRLDGHVTDDAATSARLDALTAREFDVQQQVAIRLAGSRPARTSDRPALQAVFCIDVRSERIRRALEAQSPAVETIGFAGFFGLPLAYARDAAADVESRCPALIAPSLTVCDTARPAWPAWLTSAWTTLRTSALSCFACVEATGLAFSLPMAARALPRGTASTGGAPLAEPLALDLPIGDRVALAAALLRGMGLTSRFAPLVLLCGHGATTRNNPYASALDCGACGGHAGDANARAAATLLNDPWVRFGLTAAGIVIPEDTRFAAARHDTTTDAITVGLDATEVPADVRRWLDAASAATRRERAADLGVAGTSADAAVARRADDWSELRPEWGLAGNALFIAAPRARTRGLTLDGRAFLHDYDPAGDVDGAILESILAAPVVVASWINLQYFASTADNARFGSGNKVLHNAVGALGVWEGNGGDLRMGLPWQSVHDGHALRHDPVRLSVFVEAPRARIERVLERRADVRDLVWFEWVHLVAIDPADGTCARFASGEWVPVSATHEPAADEALLAARGRAMDDRRGVDEREAVAELARQ